MKTYTMTEAKKRVADVLEDVAGGEAVTVTRRGQTVFAKPTGFVTHRPGDLANLKELGISPPRARPGQKTATKYRQQVRDERIKRIAG